MSAFRPGYNGELQFAVIKGFRLVQVFNVQAGFFDMRELEVHA